MAQIALAKTFMDDLVRLDRGLQRKVQEMIGRLQRDHTAKGLQLERYNAAEDPRSRTARVDIHTRAILASAGSDTYILVNVLPHDQADRWMENNKFSVNQLPEPLRSSTSQPSRTSPLRWRFRLNGLPARSTTCPTKHSRNLGSPTNVSSMLHAGWPPQTR